MTPEDIKEIYAQLAAKESFPFQGQPWWLDAVCGPGAWGAAMAFDERGLPRGALPFGRKRNKGLPIVTMPPLTSYFPVWIRANPARKLERSYHLEKKTLRTLLSQLPASWMISQQYNPDFSNGLPFYFEGFQTLVRYTYIIDDLRDVAKIGREMESSVRNHIRNARQAVEVSRDGEWAELHEMVARSFGRQAKKAPFGSALLERADACLSERGMRTIYVAKGGDGTHAAACVVFDGARASFLLSGADPALRQSGALYLLLWEALKDAAKRATSFDFEGSMHPPIERVFRSFGARRVPYLRAIRYRNRIFEALAVLSGKNR